MVGVGTKATPRVEQTDFEVMVIFTLVELFSTLKWVE